MAGYRTYLELRRVEEQAATLGFRFAYSKYGMRDEDVIALYPKDEAFPHYIRDAEMYCGTLEEVASFLRGIEFQNQYLGMLKLYTKEKVEVKEQHERERQLIAALKNVELGKIET